MRLLAISHAGYLAYKVMPKPDASAADDPAASRPMAGPAAVPAAAE